MSFAPVPSQSQIQEALRGALIAILPSGVEVVQAQDNQVPEPAGEFVTMTVLRRNRLGTNRTTFADCRFTGGISGTVLTVEDVAFGAVRIGAAVFGAGVAPGTVVTAFGTGRGSEGTYVVSPSQALLSAVLSTGGLALMQPTELTLQLDVHSPDGRSASDMAQTIATVLRDDVGVTLFEAWGGAIVPLHADDPRQIPFVNAEEQYETRYVVEVVLQANQVVTPPQQYTDEVEVALSPTDLAASL